MKKSPQNLPSVGDRVQLRGRASHKGKLVDTNDRLWAWVEWDSSLGGPVICHLYELEKLSDDGVTKPKRVAPAPGDGMMTDIKTSELEMEINDNGRTKDATSLATTTDDGRMILSDDAWAILWSERDGFMLRTLFDEQKDGTVPDSAIALTTCFIRLDTDPEFKQEMVRWFSSQKRN
jgi:hypothetical protein